MPGQRPSPTVAERLARASRDKTLRLKAMNFGLIGVVNTLIDYSVFYVVVFYLGLPEAVADGLPVLPQAIADLLALAVSNVPGWLFAVSCSYVLNSFITFAAESGRRLRWRDYATFVVSGIAGLFANTAALLVAAYVVPLAVAKIAAIGASFLVNFSLSHLVVFRPGRRAAKEPQ